ncbi:MAG: prolyl oligopeptidase family serine peptidase [Gemmatimonadales bacterium]|nr:prolyl oligopeptidase family serine peptidase [Gemmatimonadales bacterium]
MRQSSLLFAASLIVAVPATAQVPELTVQKIWGSREFSSDLVSVRWMEDGEYFTRTDRGESGTTDLLRVNARTGEEEVLVRGADLVPPGVESPIRIERYQFSPDGKKLLIFTNSVRVWRQNTKGEYYLWDFDAKTLSPISTEPGHQMFAKFSPDGRYVGFVREHNIFVRDMKTGDERQLTSDGDENIINGTSDWVYEEELGLRDAFRFSPDGERIAFWRLDQTVIKPFYLIDETSLYPELKPVRYPKAGAQNSEVRIGVVEITTSRTTWMDLGPEKDIYIADMDFAESPTEIWFTRLNRHQSKLDLMLADVRTGASRVIMTDQDSAWVDAGEPTWIDGGRQFLFLSERDGYRQVFLFERDGSLVRKVTAGEWDVLGFYGVDEKRKLIYFGASIDGPLARPLYRIGLNGRGLRRVTQEGGSHGISFNPTFTMYVDSYSRAGQPPVQTLRRADGRLIRTLAANEKLIAKIDSLGFTRPEFITVPGEGGVELNAYIIKPKDFDPAKRYPLLMRVYGGPGSQTVRDSWGGSNYLWYQMLAEAGYLVASVDNRGTGARGRDFKKMTYMKLGQYESDDQIAAARHFGSLPYVDADRIGIWGWSYGGYMSLLSSFRGDGAFKAAISVAPVADWKLYDTIYTERYMRTPQENPEGYEKGAPLTYAEGLTGNLLIVHGTGDDNVHSQNTTQLIQKLEQAGKQFDLRLYPNKTHSITGGNTRVNLYEYLTRWLKKNL